MTGRWHSRVSGHPEVLSELPVAVLAEEIDTPGEGQIKAMITIAGNPVLSAPDGDRLDRALDGVGFMVRSTRTSTRRPATRTSSCRHRRRRTAPTSTSHSTTSPCATTSATPRRRCRWHDRPDEAEMLSRIAFILFGIGLDADPALVDEQVIATTLAKETADAYSPVAGRAVDEVTAMLDDGRGYERRLDMMLRLGAYGDAFGAKPDGFTWSGSRRPRTV